MSRIKNITSSLVLTGFFSVISDLGFADCGVPPEKPALPDGKTVTMDKLVESSNAVKDFIAAADAHLDCLEQEMQTDEFKALDKSEQKPRKKAFKALLDERNAIGEDFNKEVKAYKAAHPE